MNLLLQLLLIYEEFINLSFILWLKKWIYIWLQNYDFLDENYAKSLFHYHIRWMVIEVETHLQSF